MNRRILKSSVILFCLCLINIIYGTGAHSGEKSAPYIFFEQTSHRFPTVFEGEKLSHTFTVLNKGSTDLQIKRVKTA